MPVEIITAQLANIPQNSGVYQFFDEKDQILYIGKAKNLKNRIKSYTKLDGSISDRIKRMVFLAQKLEFIQTTTELEALLLEHNLIKKFSPKFNILLKDDKTFPHIFLSAHRFPQISKHRGLKKEGGQYFGPFASANDVNRVIDVLKKSFLLRDCSDSEFQRRTKPCLEYQIKRCCSPCVNLINERDYENLVKNAVDFLEGKSIAVQEELAKKMQFFSDCQEYEKAASIRDRIKSLSSIQAKQNINIEELKNTDIITLVAKDNQICIYISFYRGGNNYGSKPYFYSFDNDDLSKNPGQNLGQNLGQNFSVFLSKFLGQFYLSQNPPELILNNIELDEKELMVDFLSKISGSKITIKNPKQGDKASIIKDQEQIALQNLEQKIIENLSNKNLLLEVKEIFNLNEIPKKIEVYDNSHISGEYAVGALIAAGAEGFVKSGYRKFNINFIEKNRDDTAMLKEVLRRRFRVSNTENLPDLIIIDGGLTQLNAAKGVFDDLKLDIKFVCMSKGENRNAGEEYFHRVGFESFTLPKNHKIMFYLQQLRDEAHRFAITTHRNKRAKSITKSGLDEIPGIGKSRKKALLNYFGSFDKIKSATVEDLMRVDGISRSIAEKICKF